jgi:hypothetical protein
MQCVYVVETSIHCIDRERYGFGQWMNTFIIHDNICSLIHKKRHPKSYHNDIKYHMTLNTKFNVVGTYKPNPTRSHLVGSRSLFSLEYDRRVAYMGRHPYRVGERVWLLFFTKNNK